jgi:hypothetical protein
MTRASGYLPGLEVSSLALLLTFTIGCNSSSHVNTVNPTPPSSSGASVSVTSVQPTSGATGVATNAAIQITFSSAVNSATVDSADIVVTNSNATAIAGAVTYNSATDTATFTPSVALATSTKYTVTVTGVSDSSGGAMTSSFSSTFTTAGPQYQATFFPSGGSNTGTGQISMDSSGNMTVELTGGAASTAYTLQFCPAEPAGEPSPIVCTNEGTVTTTAGGSADATLVFGQPGSWAGDFQLSVGANSEYMTDIIPATDSSTEVYMSTLQPENVVNGKELASGSTPQDPLTSGTVTYSSGSLQFVLTGTSANTSISSVETDDYIGSSSSYALLSSQNQGAFTTDSQGDVTFTVLQDNDAGDLFVAVPQNSGAGFIGGFSVPQ